MALYQGKKTGKPHRRDGWSIAAIALSLVVVGLIAATILAGVHISQLKETLLADTYAYVDDIVDLAVGGIQETIAFTKLRLSIFPQVLYRGDPDVDLLNTLAYIQRTDGFRIVGLFDEEGEGALSDGRTFSIAGDPILNKALEAQREPVIEHRVSPFTGDEELLMAVAFRNATEDMLVFVAQMPVDIFTPLKDVTLLDGRSPGFLFTRAGEQIYAVPATRALPEFKTIGDLFGTEAGAVSALATAKENFEKGIAGEFRYSADGLEYVVMYRPLADTDWIFAYFFPVEELEAPVQKVWWRTSLLLMVAGAFLLLCAGVIVYLLLETRRHRFSGEIYHREQLFRLMSKHIDDGFLFLTEKGSCEFASANLEKVLGIPSAAFEDAPEGQAVSFFGTAIDEKVRLFCQSDSRQPLVHAFNWRHHQSGETRAMNLRCYPIQPTEGKRHFLVMLSDRTMEQNTQRLMRSAMQAAETASETKTRFLSSMSHEIRTPLNAIIGMTRIALSGRDDLSRMVDCLTKIDASSKHLLELINDVLDMSRIESGTTTIAREPFSLLEMLSQLTTLQRPQAETKGVRLITEIGAFDSAWVVGDMLRMNQVLINIVGNAIKFTPAGGAVRILAEQTRRSGNNIWVRFQIVDSGIGMDAEFVPKVFDAFSQERTGAAASQYGGTGLGMSITKNLVTLMNGTINVRSRLGEGTTFTVEIAFTITEAVRAEEEATNLADAEKQLKGLRVLLAEDNELNTEIMLAMLESLDIQAENQYNGQDAVTAFAKSEVGAFDCILMDIQMPVMDGLEATRAIRAMDRPDAKTIPIIAITANAFREDVTRSLESGMNDHVSKPVDPKNLTEVMSRVIRRKREGISG